MTEDELRTDSEVELEKIEDQGKSGIELDTLHLENIKLRSQVADYEAEKVARGHPWRRAGVIFLIVLGCILLAVSNLIFWAWNTALNTNGWVAAVGPLTENPIVVEAVSGFAAQELDTALDVEVLVLEALPEKLNGLSEPLAGAIGGLVQDLITKVIESDAFQDAWVAVNRTVHRTVVTILRGEGTVVYVREGQVTIDLSDLFASIQDELGIRDLGLISEEDTIFVLFSDDQLAELQRIVSLIDTIGVLLPLVTLILFVVAWLISLTRRRTLFWIGIGAAITMVVELVLFLLIEPLAFISVSDPLIKTLAGAIWDTITQPLINQTFLLMVIGLLIAFAAWFAGPNAWAVETRTSIRSWWAERGKK
jgi:hypothetical protein